jgi:hypothetical protein
LGERLLAAPRSSLKGETTMSNHFTGLSLGPPINTSIFAICMLSNPLRSGANHDYP